MREAAGVQRHHARMNVVTREEIAGVIEDHFVVVIIIVEERNFDRARIGFEGAWHEGANHKAIGDEGRMSGRRQMVTVTHQRTDVAHVDARDHEVAMPAHRIERIEWIGNGGDCPAALHTHLPALGVA